LVRVEEWSEKLKPATPVTVVGTSKGKGFAGVVKRWHFKGGPATHGQSDRQRAPGSVGGTTTPGRVYRGKKMPGRMGGGRVTVKGLEIVEADEGAKVVKISGAVPGARNGEVILKIA
jgi:large subunit ribosomal protein L3